MNRFLLGICLCILSISLSHRAKNTDQQQDLPKVFLIGEYEHAFETLSTTHSDILLTVCNDDMDFAYDQWTDMLASLEDYSDRIDYDIKGAKLYMYVFWDADGTIAHLAFYPKPNSRNIPLPELKAVFKGFIKEYRLPIRSDKGFSHYASASFPIFYKPEFRVKKD